MIVVSDTSPISNLLQIHRLNLLGQLYGQIIIPPAVDLEIKALKKFKIDIAEYEGSTAISVKVPFDSHAVNELVKHIDIGESQAIVLAKELHADLLLIDERLGTRWAKESGLKTIGLIGTLILA